MSEYRRKSGGVVVLLAAALMPMPAKIAFGVGELSIARGYSVAVAGACDGRVTRFAKKAGGPMLTVTCLAAGKAVQAADEDESYRLDVTKEGARIAAPNSLGALRGLATFRQLSRGDAVPVVSIDDRPRFPWRGLHLDVSRHWMPVEVVERNLEGMWAVKLNVFHWHLSDNQGFRVESKRYPKLHAMGSDGNYYTQDQIRAVIAYARDRGIRVMPEFDLPGHSTAMLAGYPELGSAPGPFQIGRTWGIFDPVMDPTRDDVYKFLDGFIGEMAGLFPDAYFHIGGDEVNGKEWNANADIVGFKRGHGITSNDGLQAYFNRRIQPVVTKYGKTMMGWDEILQPDLPKDIVIHSWRGAKSLADAIAMGFQGVLSSGYYLDHMSSAGEHYLVDPGALKGILGGEVCTWSEYVTAENVDSRIWPRTAAMAERFWSPAALRDVPGMYARLGEIDRELDALGLKQNANYEVMLRRLAGGGPVEPVKTLADVVEPVGLGGRARARVYTQQTPLNRLVDTARPDSETARAFAELVEKREWGAVRKQLTVWKDNGQAMGQIVSGSVLLGEAAGLSGELTEMGAMGLEALGLIESGAKAPGAWVAEKKAALAAMKKPQAEVRFAICDAVGRLVEGAR
jgi:hexosaminidase